MGAVSLGSAMAFTEATLDVITDFQVVEAAMGQVLNEPVPLATSGRRTGSGDSERHIPDLGLHRWYRP